MTANGIGIVGGVVLVDPDTGLPYKATGGGGGGAVASVNGQTGVVVLSATNVGAVDVVNDPALQVEFRTGSWGARPTTTGAQFVRARSVRVVPGASDLLSAVIAAVPPPWAIEGDTWTPHPDSPYLVA